MNFNDAFKKIVTWKFFNDILNTMIIATTTSKENIVKMQSIKYFVEFLIIKFARIF